VQNYENAESRQNRVGLKPVEDRSMKACMPGHFHWQECSTAGESKLGAALSEDAVRDLSSAISGCNCATQSGGGHTIVSVVMQKTAVYFL
jgi:hypothetical protein